ncbi:protein gurken-like isoform X2 [Nilaparvata lugens]|uniref:protein gurken-like isoform X2 n=1 Tax=Nilaparvata lugens TaxID=108931 RepID=UPI000B985B1E|nr:protein gurken-like isoform X2 [Nilaparvata lugens]
MLVAVAVVMVVVLDATQQVLMAPIYSNNMASIMTRIIEAEVWIDDRPVPLPPRVCADGDDACSSRSTPKPRPPAPTARPNVTFHTYACPPAYATWYCLNGATCFTVKIAESLLYNCECANGYMGQRCEFKDLEGSYLPSRQRVASIASGATIAVFLVVIVCASLYIRYQRRLKLSRATSCVDGGGDLERRDPFSRPRPTALPLSRVTTESSSECATTSLYMHHHVGEGRGEPPIPHPAAPP